MSLITIALLGIGILLVYSAITGEMPKDVVLKALGQKKEQEKKNGN